MTDSEIFYNWIAKIITSCAHSIHFEGVDILISLFDSKFSDQPKVTDLKDLRWARWNLIHGILV